MKHAVIKIWLMMILGIGTVLLSGCSFSSPLKGEETDTSAFTKSESAGANESGGTKEESRGDAKEEEKTGGENSDDIFVHVCGCVKNPGLYRLPGGARLKDAVDAAGGFTKKADQNARNLAEVLTDGMQAYIPSKEENAGADGGASESSGEASADSGEDGKVNINTASESELLALPGIGETRAAAILACRREKGSFASIEEIKNAQGIGEGIFNQIKDLITVG